MHAFSHRDAILPTAAMDPTAIMEPSAALRLPDTILLGLPKAGTSKLHECLTSDVFADSKPCCASKEMNLFLAPRPRSAKQRAEALRTIARGTPAWPRVTEPSRRLLDFTPAYLVSAKLVLPELQAAYRAKQPAGSLPTSSSSASASAQPLHFVVVLRSPAERTRSHFCTASHNPRPLIAAFRTPTTCATVPMLCESWTRRRSAVVRRTMRSSSGHAAQPPAHTDTPSPAQHFLHSAQLASKPSSPNPCEPSSAPSQRAGSSGGGSSGGGDSSSRSSTSTGGSRSINPQPSAARCANDSGYITTCAGCPPAVAVPELYQALPRIATRVTYADSQTHSHMHMPHATCYMPHATCHMLHATCYMPHVCLSSHAPLSRSTLTSHLIEPLYVPCTCEVADGDRC